jgi:hypothetical protein
MQRMAKSEFQATKLFDWFVHNFMPCQYFFRKSAFQLGTSKKILVIVTTIGYNFFSWLKGCNNQLFVETLMFSIFQFFCFCFIQYTIKQIHIQIKI